MDDEGRTRWAILLVPLLLIGLASVPARADLLVSRLNREPVTVNQIPPGRRSLSPLWRGLLTEEHAAAQPAPATNGEDNALALAVLATVLFNNPDHASPQTQGTSGGSTGGTTSSSGGGTSSGGGGGGTTNPTDHAPEPATLISALVGTSLAGLYAAFRRKRLVKPRSTSLA